ncbi:MAG: peptidoglycan-associated lipoprotein Pal [Burkholderiales bacterium]
MKRFTLYLLLTGLLAACASESPKTQPGAQVEDRTQASKTAQQPVDTRPLTPPQQAVNPLNDPNNILSKRSVFYDFDSYDIKPEYKALIEAHGNYLASHPTAKVSLQGNTDERGSREYNLALGQKRADSVRKMLSLSGVKAQQMETVSFGEEKPRATCHDESCWSQNRRTDIVYQSE